MKSIIFNNKMICDLQDTGKAVKLSLVTEPSIKDYPNDWKSAVELQDGTFVFWNSPLDKEVVELSHEQYEGGGLCPPCFIGEIRWVKETWAVDVKYGNQKPSEIFSGVDLYFQADGHSWENVWGHKWGVRGNWRPSVHMPRWASRYMVKCTAVEAVFVDGLWHWRNEYEVVTQ